MNYETSRLKVLFSYDPETGVVLNRIRRGCARQGERAGYFDKGSGYRRVDFEGHRGVLEHRVIFALMTGEWPTMEIDHINGDRSDNRRSNLRHVSHKQNMANQGPRKDKIKGVYWHKDRRKWQASIFEEGRLRYLGLFETEHLARLAYNSAGQRIHGEFFREA